MIYHHEFEAFYFMGRRDVKRDKIHGHRPFGWCAKEWFAYQDGVQEEWAEIHPAEELLWLDDEFAD